MMKENERNSEKNTGTNIIVKRNKRLPSRESADERRMKTLIL